MNEWKYILCVFSVQNLFMQMKRDEQLYNIERIIDFHPRRGFFVHWEGYSESDRSWQKAKDMPSGLRKEMALMRQSYKLRTYAEKVPDQTPRRSQTSAGKCFNLFPLGDPPPSDAVAQAKPPVNQAKCIAYAKRPVSSSLSASSRPSSLRAKAMVTRKSMQEPQRFVADSPHSILQFDPARGYLVHWRNSKPSEDCWLYEDEIGSGFQTQKRLASERYCDSLL
jgi:hypothetical protein